MPGRIPREFIDDLLLRVDIVDLIDSHVPLKKAGNSYKARCPFHTEKSPSFSVNRQKQFFHCFGCGAGGNAISFLMEFNHLDFVEAIEGLANFAGIDVPRETLLYQEQKTDFNAVYSILEQAAIFYVEQMRNHPQGIKAIEYLKQRGLSGETAKTFSLGYAPDEWDALATRFDKKLLLNAGMLVKRNNDSLYDRFRGRLIFPIRDKRSRIIGFGGRVLDNSLPKYLNSPETAVFSKGKELYGLYELLEKNAKPKRIIIVEGYLDVLTLSQFGIGYSVAALGTAISKTHLDLLFRFTSELVFCFDGDGAGQKATWRGTQESFPCLKDGRQLRIMLLPQGQDPDSLIRTIGIEGFEEQIEDSQLLSDYYFEHRTKELDTASVEGKSQLLSKVKPDIEKIPAGFFREMMFTRLIELSESSTDVLKDSTMLEIANERKRTAPQGSKSKPKDKASPARIVIELLLQNPKLIEIVEQQEFNWTKQDFPGAAILIKVLQTIKEKKPKNTAVLVEFFRGTANEKIVNALVNGGFFILEDGVEAEFSGALNLLQMKIDEKIWNDLMHKEKAEGLNQDEKNQLQKILIKMAKK